MNFFVKLFSGARRQLKSTTTSAVKPIVPREGDPWETREVVQDKGGLEKMTSDAAKIASEERLGNPINPEGGNTRA